MLVVQGRLTVRYVVLEQNRDSNNMVIVSAVVSAVEAAVSAVVWHDLELVAVSTRHRPIPLLNDLQKDRQTEHGILAVFVREILLTHSQFCDDR